MKSILKNGTYLRVSDEVAEIEVRKGNAKYVSKTEWKQNTKVVTEAVTTEHKEQVKSKKAEKAAKLKAKQRQ